MFTSLDLSSNFLRTLEPSTFVGLTGLKSLDLRINMITRLQTGSFNGLNSVEQIKLTLYVSTYIDKDGRSILDILHSGGQNFRGRFLLFTRQHLKTRFLGVKKHFLEGPGLDVIEDGVFRNLSLLHDLELSTNCIRNISNKMLHGLSSLRKLSLNQTCIQMLEPYTFMEFPHLLELDLSVNRIEVLFLGVFQGLMKLRTLNLGFNKIQTVQSEAFSGLIQLHILDMIGNNIPRITKGMFKELVMLRVLNLPYNDITTIESDAFQGLSLLKHLNLAVNKVSSISSENFLGLKRLVYLDLTRNSELVIQPRALQGLQIMKTVGLTIKQDTNFTGGVMSVLQGLLQGVYSVQEMSLTGLDTVLPPAAFQGFHISSLDLSNNYIPLLKSNTFAGLSLLRTLKLNWNKLLTITVGAFRQLHTLTFLTLTNNEISSLPAGVFQGLNSLETLLLYDNKLSILEEGVFGAVCRKLTYPTYDIPLSGEAYHNSCCEVFNSLLSLQHLDLSANKLKYIHPNTFICNVQLRTLKLSFNRMLSLDTNFLFIPSLRVLEMLFCNITELSNDTFRWTPKLSKLDLVRNKIRTIDVESLKQFVKLEVFYIHDNPLVCDCKLQETLYWLHSHHTAYYDGTFCVLGNSSVEATWDKALYGLECDSSYFTPESMVSADELEFFKEILEPSILGLIFFIGVLGNGFLLFIFTRHPKMCSGPNLYLLNLTISDLLNLVVNLPLNYWDILHGSWELGLPVCKLFMGMRDLTVGVTVFCVVALSIQRYCVIVHSFTQHRGFWGMSEHKIVLLSLLLVWGLAFGFALPTFLTATVERRCFFSPHGIEYTQRTWVIQLIIYCVVPVSIIALLYVRTACHLKDSVRNMPGEGKAAVQARGRNRVANMVIILTVVFSLSYIPNFVLRVLFVWSVIETTSITTHFMSFVSFCLFFCNSCFNPIALICMSTVFKDLFFRYICYGFTVGMESPIRMKFHYK
jgi:Leucine-rich repeat (LRR) protein